MATDMSLAAIALANPAPATIANPAAVQLLMVQTVNGVATAYAPSLAEIAAYVAAILGTSASSGLAIAGTPAASAVVGAAYNFSPDATGGTGPYTYAITGALPSGLTFSTASGEINGAATVAGASDPLSITATDALGATATLGPFVITVAAAPVGGVASDLTTGTTGQTLFT